jgi:PKD repeat protein
LTLSQASGVLATISKNNYITITTIPLVMPVADFFGTPTSGTAPLTVTFSDLSTENPRSWNWSFGDNSIENATEQNPVHTYTNPGTYSVSLNATNADGSDTQTRSEYIKVNPAAVPLLIPVADFFGTPTSGVVPLTVTFSDLSANTPVSWDWSFGDNSPENTTEQNPVHTYTNPGTYSVSLNATNADGSDTQTRSEYIKVNPAVPVILPVADFFSEPTSGISPLTVKFSDLSTNVPTSWNWSFGDDSIENATEQNPVHTYTNPGTYSVSLNATNADGSDTRTRSEYIRINPAPAQYALPVSAPPVAEFTASPTSGVIPLIVTFTDLSTNTPTAWNWSFGDDSLENTTEQNPVHVYNDPGTYSVSLNVTNADGSDTQTRTNYIKVTPSVELLLPVADFSGDPTNGVAPLTVAFTDLSTNTPTAWNWSFGDDSLENATEQNPVHTYINKGTFTISLNATNADGSNITTKTEFINISDTPLVPLPPVADFSVTPTSGFAPLTVTFKDLSQNTPTSWNWSFGDGNTSTIQNLTYTYSTVGVYTVSLNARNAEGSNTSVKINYINVTEADAGPVVDFSGTPTSGLTPLTVQFNDLSTGFHEPITYLWNFGDGFNSTERNPTHIYSAILPENYTVTLNVSGNYGQTDEMIKSGYISIDIPTIELTLTEESLDQMFPSDEPIPPTQSLPQGQSLPMTSSVSQSRSLQQSEPQYRDQSLPLDISTHNQLSAVLQSPNVQWSLNRGENTNPHAFSMIVHSTIDWKVIVFDAANYGKPGTPGKMSEYDYINSRYLSGGYTLLNALHLQTEQFKFPENLGPDVLLSATHNTLQTGPPMVSHDNPFKYYINLKQRIEDNDHASSQNIGYRIVITFEALPLNF